MIDMCNQLKNELAVLNPGIKDEELDKMTNNLINFFTIGAKALYAVEKDFISLSDVDDTKSNKDLLT